MNTKPIPFTQRPAIGQTLIGPNTRLNASAITKLPASISRTRRSVYPENARLQDILCHYETGRYWKVVRPRTINMPRDYVSLEECDRYGRPGVAFMVMGRDKLTFPEWMKLEDEKGVPLWMRWGIFGSIFALGLFVLGTGLWKAYKWIAG